MSVADSLQFFKDNEGYERIFSAIYARYRSLGRLGGTVTIADLTPAEKAVLSNHLLRDMGRLTEISFGVQEFAASLKITKFARFSLEEILAFYFALDELSSAKEDAERFTAQRAEFFAALLKKSEGSPAETWFRAIFEQRALGSRKILRAYSTSPQKLEAQLEMVSKALHILDKRGTNRWRLPVLASLVTTNPHSFDLDTDLGALLVDALCTIYELEQPQTREDIKEVLYFSGILVDELSNYVSCAGLTSYRGGQIHPVWQGALEMGEPLQVPLLNLSKISRVQSALGIVFAVENPAVFTGILEACSAEMLPPLVCTSGQVKLAGLALLDLLAKEGTTIYYSGDLDPEGISIAQRLARRYRGLFEYWRFTCSDYDRALSTNQLSRLSLSKLNKIQAAQLEPLVASMLKRKRAAYQELLLPDLIRDVQQIMAQHSPQIPGKS